MSRGSAPLVADQCASASARVVVPFATAKNSRMGASKWNPGPSCSVSHSLRTWLQRCPGGTTVCHDSGGASCFPARLRTTGAGMGVPSRNAMSRPASSALPPPVRIPCCRAKPPARSSSSTTWRIRCRREPGSAPDAPEYQWRSSHEAINGSLGPRFLRQWPKSVSHHGRRKRTTAGAHRRAAAHHPRAGCCAPAVPARAHRVARWPGSCPVHRSCCMRRGWRLRSPGPRLPALRWPRR